MKEYMKECMQHCMKACVPRYRNDYPNQLGGKQSVIEYLEGILTHMMIRAAIGDKEEIVFEIGTSIEDEVYLYASEAQGFKFQKSIGYMQQHFGEMVTVKQLAEIENESVSSYTKHFKAQMGKTPKEYFILLRLKEAKRLLEADEKSITDIALICGFGSIAHFSNCFSAHYGISPTQYKNMFQS